MEIKEKKGRERKERKRKRKGKKEEERERGEKLWNRDTGRNKMLSERAIKFLECVELV